MMENKSASHSLATLPADPQKERFMHEQIPRNPDHPGYQQFFRRIVQHCHDFIERGAGYSRTIREEAVNDTLEEVLTILRDESREVAKQLCELREDGWHPKRWYVTKMILNNAYDLWERERIYSPWDDRLNDRAAEGLDEQNVRMTPEEETAAGQGYKHVSAECQHVLQTWWPFLPEHKHFDRKTMRFDKSRAQNWDPDQAARWAPDDSDREWSIRKDTAHVQLRDAVHRLLDNN